MHSDRSHSTPSRHSSEPDHSSQSDHSGGAGRSGNARSGNGRSRQPLFSRRQRIILWLACSAIFFEAFDVSIVNLVLPVMAESLKIQLASTQWIQTIYLLSFGGFLLLGGRLCDWKGSKRIFLTGMSLFGVASAIALFSDRLPWLLLARAAQGMGAALAIPAGISLLSRHFKEGDERQTAMGIFGAFAAVGFAGGLALGGLIASFFDWHWIFGLNVPIIAIVLVLGRYYIPAEKAGGQPANFITAVWLTVTLLLLCYGIHESSRLGWWVIPYVSIALGSGFLLMRYDSRQQQPFFVPGIFPASSAAYRSLGASFLLGATFLSFVFVCTLGLTGQLKWGIKDTGLLLFPYSIGSALVSKFLLPVLFRKLGPAGVGLTCMICLLGGALLLAAGLYTGGIGWFLAALLLVNSFAIAIGYPAFTVLTLSGVAERQQGIAAGIQSAINSMGTGIGLSLTGSFLEIFADKTIALQLVASCGMIAICCLIAVGLLWRSGGRR